MAKFLIAKQNIPYDNTYKHVFKFKNSFERDQYLNEYLFSGENYLLKFKKAKDGEYDKIDSLKATIIIETETDIFNKNYLILKENLHFSFYFITKIETIKDSLSNISKNFEQNSLISPMTLTKKKYKLELELDIFMSYFEIFDKIKNFKLFKGHVPQKYYYGRSFTDGEKQIKKITPLKKATNNIKNTDFLNSKDNSWIFIIKKQELYGENTLKIISNNDLLLETPYEVWIVPSEKIRFDRNINLPKWLLNSDLINSEETTDTFKSKISFFDRKFLNFTIVNQNTDKEEIFSIKTKEIVLGKKYPFLFNKEYKISFCFLSEYEYQIKYQNSENRRWILIALAYLTDKLPEIDFIWSPKEIKNWLINGSPTDVLDVKYSNIFPLDILEKQPIEKSQNIKYISHSFNFPEHYILKYIDIKKIEQFNQYRVNMAEKEFLKTLSGFRSKEILIENKFQIKIPDFLRKRFFKFKHLTIPLPNEWEERVIIEGKVENVPYKLTDNDNKFNNQGGFFYTLKMNENYKANTPPVTELKSLNTNLKNITNSLRGIESEGKIKNNHLEISPSGNEYYNMALNKNGNNWLLVEYQYLDGKNKNTFQNIKLKGLTFDDGFFVEEYSKIKRPIFNYLKINNLNDSEFNLEVSMMIKKAFRKAFANGITVWNKYQKFMMYQLPNSREEQLYILENNLQKLYTDLIDTADRYLFLGQNGAYTIFDIDFNELKNHQIDLIIRTSQKLPKEQFLFQAGDFGKWLFTNQRGYFLNKGKVKNQLTIFTSSLLKSNLLFLGQNEGNWTFLTSKGKEISNGQLTNKLKIKTSLELDNENIFIGQDYGNWTIIKNDGEIVKSGYLSNSSQGTDYFSTINCSLKMQNGDIFLGQNGGNWTTLDQKGNEIQNGYLENNKDILTLEKFKNNNLFLGQGFGYFTILDNDLEISYSDFLPNTSTIISTVVLKNGDIFAGQANGYWAIINKSDQIISSGTTINQKNIETIILLDPKESKN